MAQYTMLEKDFQEISARFKTCEAEFNTPYDLFKSFVDNDAERVLLPDTGYSLKHINHAALELFSVPGESDMPDRKISDFMPYKDALRLKAKIDRAFIKGEKEKVKDVRFRLPDNALAKLKMKIVGVRYQDRPSVKLVIR
ncbi:hypothetical protein DENIS_2722 [Desulfonema ishimotonii]|uniref:PAS domain-containing protein n=1 Tax=Desulfonema ishimotonii TaxID=45657 RepID=A0A401FXS1_9BACT|nr:hypothetical protein [Desulfonema ishimotonii]GBC61760.1 hypothetical protein DENIS_2722 [Desulfonema ishimotonii]